MVRTSAAKVNVELVGRRIRHLAEIGATSDGITRLAFTAEEREAHRLFAHWGEETAKRVEVDSSGNTVAVWNEGDRYFLLGSHLDTVPHGGAYDGAAGVVAALEAARLLEGRLKLGLRIVAFAGEEGARFGRPNLGSAASTGLLTRDEAARLADADGVTLLDAGAALGLSPGSGRKWIDENVVCFFEVHIEQGRQLELRSLRLGLVDAIAGSIRMRFDLAGRADHSGATPMELRADALAAASELTLAAEHIGREYRSTVVTVGRLEIEPNSVTTVPGAARLWVDIRDIDAERQRLAARRLLVRSRQIGAARGVAVRLHLISNQAPVVLDAWPRAIARDVCGRRGVPFRVLPSGAGHDAAIVARRAPAAMLFVPCAGGVSHAPAERAEPRDIAEAAGLVAAVIQRADDLLA